MKKIRLHWFAPEHGKLKTKLLWVFFLLVVLPLGLFTLYAYFRIRSVAREQTFSAAQNAFDSSAASVQQALDKLDEVLDILSADPLVYAMASNDPKDITYIKRLEDTDKLALTFQHLRKLSGVARIRLYADNEYLYASGQNNILQASEVSETDWYQTACRDSRRSWFSPADFAGQPEEEQHLFSAMQVIYNPRAVMEPLAVLRADADAAYILQYLNAPPVVENGTLLLLRGTQVLCASDTGITQQEQLGLARSLPASGGGWKPVEWEGRRYYAQWRELEGTDWRMAVILPAAGVFRLSRELRLEMLAVVVLLGIAAYLLAYVISQSTLNRISLFAKTMESVEQGNVRTRLMPEGDDEIAQLMGGFDRMMDRIDSLMEERVEYARQIKHLELKALQAQINPHFLYNSLDLINCTAISRNVPEISRMVRSLGQFYRASLSHGKEVIPLADEIRHARLYMEIQNMRFDNRLQTEWQLDESAGRCQVIKIILQPLIENAMIHGIFEKPSKTGTIRVCTRREGGLLRITVEDDGVGMNEAARLANFSPSSPGSTETEGGYGVRNICDRLHIVYGDPYGLFCESVPGRGTKVTILLPAVEPKPAESQDE